jgi:hypothetical protein
MFGRFRKRDAEPRVEIEQKTSDEAVRLLVRNNARIQTMRDMVDRFGSKATSGRYFSPEKGGVADIVEWCSGNGLFVKKSDLGSVVALDVMTDKDLRYK